MKGSCHQIKAVSVRVALQTNVELIESKLIPNVGTKMATSVAGVDFFPEGFFFFFLTIRASIYPPLF